MLTPLKYYGGKTRLTPWILKLFPKDYQSMTYAEPFAGGLSVFFNKQPSKKEIISDINKNLMSVYRVLKNDYKALSYYYHNTEHSELENKFAKSILKSPSNDLQKAWAYLVLLNSTFAAAMDTFAYNINFKRKYLQERKNINHFFRWHNRLLQTTILSQDANAVIRQYDSPNTLFYLDPPYPESDQGHYEGYTMKNFNDLLELLNNIKGKFLLSCFIKKDMNINKNWIKSYKTRTLHLANTRTQETNKPENRKFLREELLLSNYKN